MKTKNENTIFYKVFGAVFALVLLFVPLKALAVNYQFEVDISADGDGYVSNPSIANFTDYGFATNNSTSGIACRDSADFTVGTCPIFVNSTSSGWSYSTLVGSTAKMELGFSNGAVGSTPDGYYMVSFLDSGSGNTLYFKARKISGTWSSVALVDGVYPSTPVASTTVAYNVVFSGTYNNSLSYDEIVFAISDLTDSMSIGQTYSLPLINGSGLPYSFTKPLTPNHDYEYQAWLRDSSDNSISAVTSFVDFSTSALVLDTPAWTPETCDSIITDFGACIRNFVHETFYPSAESISQFTTLTLRNSAPFSYIYDMGTLYNELFANGGTEEYAVSATTPLGDITFISADMIEDVPYSGFIKTILGYMMWFFTGMFIYRVILRVHNK